MRQFIFDVQGAVGLKTPDKNRYLNESNKKNTVARHTSNESGVCIENVFFIPCNNDGKNHSKQNRKKNAAIK